MFSLFSHFSPIADQRTQKNSQFSPQIRGQGANAKDTFEESGKAADGDQRRKAVEEAMGWAKGAIFMSSSSPALLLPSHFAFREVRY
jgi:hypothetical protein